MAFDSKDTAAFKGVWVFCEQREGVIMSTSYQLLSEGRKLANDLGVELCGVVLGKDIKEDYRPDLPGLRVAGGHRGARIAGRALHRTGRRFALPNRRERHRHGHHRRHLR